MRYKIPQNIDVEDRIAGPLTLRQFMIFMFGGTIIMFLFFSLSGNIGFFIFLSLIVAAITASIAFYDYGGIKIEVMGLKAFSTLTNPKKRVWKKVLPDPEKASKQALEDQHLKEIPIAVAPKSLEEIKEKIEQYAKTEDSKNDDPEVKDIFKEPGYSSTTILDKVMKKPELPKKKEDTIADLARIPPTKQFEYQRLDNLAPKQPFENTNNPGKI